MAYDRTDWHSGGDYPEDLPPENGGTHIGVFLAWIIKSNLEGDFHKESTEALEQVRNETMTGRDFFSMHCDEKLWEDDLNEEANAFAKFYYEDGTYFEDYESVLLNNLPTLYHIENTWENFHKLEPKIAERFDEWRVNHPFTPVAKESGDHSNDD
ncbi:MAG: hypothetical protein V3U71_11610 [Cocleimonas sp.]